MDFTRIGRRARRGLQRARRHTVAARVHRHGLSAVARRIGPGWRAAGLALVQTPLAGDVVAGRDAETGVETLVDDDILPIFLEETAEVLAAMDAHLPDFAADYGDHAALAQIRRAFHTLKGSGRMVGANRLGELAWSIENLLNRVLEGNLAASLEHLDLVRAARDAIPELTDAFAGRRLPTCSVVDIEASARRLAALSSGNDDDLLSLDADLLSTAAVLPAVVPVVVPAALLPTLVATALTLGESAFHAALFLL